MDANSGAEWRGWLWQPDRMAWFGAFHAAAAAWRPPPELRLDVPAFRARVATAAQEGAPWLVHPCMGAMLGNAAGQDANARLAAWVAVNTPMPQRSALGALTLDRETCVWLADGPQLLAARTHPFSSWAGVPHEPSGPALPDPWGDSLPDLALAGEMGDATWWAQRELSDEAQAELTANVRTLLALQSLLQETIPETAAWMRAVARVVVPLVSSDAEEFRSGSIAGVPGLVFVEVTQRQLLVLEALVHESAHLHFHLAEFGCGFIAAGHAQMYASPLRRDPRPLRGIFLAYHALLYMCAFYKDWEARVGDGRAGQARAQLARQRDAAAQVLHEARPNLSEAGAAFLARCVDLASADDRR